MNIMLPPDESISDLLRGGRIEDRVAEILADADADCLDDQDELLARRVAFRLTQRAETDDVQARIASAGEEIDTDQDYAAANSESAAVIRGLAWRGINNAD